MGHIKAESGFFGTINGYFTSGLGSISSGYVSDDNNAKLQVGDCAFAGGRVKGINSRVAALGYWGNFAFGSTFYKGEILSTTKSASFSHGYVNSNGKIKCKNHGSFAQGYISTFGRIYAGLGSFSQGCIINSSSVYSYINSYMGGFSQGYITGKGSVIGGSTGKGCFSQGFITGNYCNISATGNGSFAQGTCDGNGTYILASNKATLSQGFVIAGSHIKNNNIGGFVQGYARTSHLESTGKGAFIHGYLNSPYNITASGNGSFIQTFSTDAKISSGVGSILFCSDNGVKTYSLTNSVNNSLMLGGINPIRIIGSGLPTSPQDGDIWTTYYGYVYMRSYGNTCKVVNAVL